MKRVVLRADGSTVKGLGHIMRSLSLVQLLQKDFRCLFISNNSDQAVKDLVTGFCTAIFIEAGTNEEEIKLLRNCLLPDDIVVTDGYQFDEQYQRELRTIVHKLVMIDDKAELFFCADAVINHGGLSDIPPYRTEPYTKIFYGFPYLIARQEFIDAAAYARIVDVIDTAFICMGGADPFHITIKALQACTLCPFIQQIIIVTGSFFPDATELKQLIAGIKDKEVRWYENANAAEMVHYISSSQLSFSTASSIAMEICCVKAGLITGVVIDNQCSIHHQLVSNRCALSVGNWIDASIEDIVALIEKANNPSLVNEIMNNQAKCIDGKSGERIVDIFKQLAT